VFTHGLMEDNMMVSMFKISKMVSGLTFGLMDENIQVCGKMESNMGKEFLHPPRV